jgi:hypothetical protein
MFDLNAILTQALTAAVTEATKPLLERIAALETKLALETTLMQGETLSPDDLVQVKQRIEVLENTSFAPINEARLVEVLDQQEWFWEKLMRKAGEAAEAAAEEAINDHCSTYDHDDYDRAVTAIEDADLDDIVTYSNIKDAVGEALNNATLSISV